MNKVKITDMFESPNTAADFVHFINPTLIFIVSQEAVYAASVAFLLCRLLHEARTLNPPQFGRWFVLRACKTN